MERGACALFLLRAVMIATASPTGDPTIDDEFTIERLYPEARTSAKEPAGDWSQGKVSLAGLLSLQWPRQGLRLGAVEYFALGTIVLFLAVYLRGRRRNYDIAHTFIRSVHSLFCARFLEAGPALETPPVDRRQLLARDTCSSFLYYATGSRSCSSVLVTISLTKRHDLFMLLWHLFNPVADTVTVEVGLGADDLEPLVFAVSQKRDAKKILQEIPHLQDYAGVTRSPSLPSALACLSESSTLVEPLLPSAAVKTLTEYHDLLELMHFTDQNQQPILGQAVTPRKALRFRFRIEVAAGDRTRSTRGAVEMIELALFYIEFLHKFQMAPGMKKKALERREAVAKRKAKLTHAQRQERLQQLKNEKLQREREEYENLTPEQKRRRDLRDEKRAKKASGNKKLKMKLTRS